MEKADGVVMLESDFDWDDVGEWPVTKGITPLMKMQMYLKAREKRCGFSW